MEEGENLHFRSHLHGRISVHLNDEHNRLVFKTPPWLKTLHMHGFLILPLFHDLLSIPC